DSADDGGEIVVSENHVCGILCNVATGDTHGDTDIGALQGRRVVDTVTSHDTEGSTTMQSLNHADLGARTTPCNDERELFELVHLIVREGVKVAGSHDDRVGLSRRNSLGQDSNLVGNGGGGTNVVTGQHVNLD